METAIDRTSDASREIVKALRQRVQAAATKREDRLDERVSRYWIAWRSRNRDRVFAEIRPLRARVEVFILPGPRDLRDAGRLARRAPKTQGWGWFRTRFDVRSMGEVESAARLIVQSYMYGARVPNGHPARKARRTGQGL